MKKIIITLIVGIILVSGCTLAPNDKCMGSYNKDIANKNVKLENEYTICSNKNNEPIFKDNNKALNKIKKEYSDTLDVIKETFNLKEFNNNNINDYYIYSSQLIATTESNKKEAANLSTLLEIYQNSY